MYSIEPPVHTAASQEAHVCDGLAKVGETMACLAINGQAFSALGRSSDMAAACSKLLVTWRPHSDSASCGERWCLLVAPTTTFSRPCKASDTEPSQFREINMHG